MTKYVFTTRVPFNSEDCEDIKETVELPEGLSEDEINARWDAWVLKYASGSWKKLLTPATEVATDG